MRTLFNVKINWSLYILLAVLIRLVFNDIHWYIYIAIMIFIHQFLLLFYSIGSIIPVRYLLGSFMCLQLLLGPSIAYMGADEYRASQYKMQLPLEDYFSYVLPAIVAFIAGLHITAKKLKGEILNVPAIYDFTDKNPQLPYYLIGLGFIFSYMLEIVPAEIGFVLVLLANFKFIGLFLVILSRKPLPLLSLTIVITSIVASSIIGAMFHDLLTWAVFIGAVLAIKYQPSISTKTIFTISFILLSFVIQNIKKGYRQAVWYGNEEASLETFEKVYSKTSSEAALFSKYNFSEATSRINQGFIVTHIMQNIPAKMSYSNGDELKLILESAFLPRILAPNKLNAGDRELFMKYSGMRIHRGTSMALGSVGDAYINFGKLGGSIFMFLYGLLFSSVLNILHKASKNYPIILLFSSLMFYYPIRPDCELQTILGHLFKSAFLVYVIFLFFKRRKSEREQKSELVPG